ncbi:hypothetical protein RB653_002489 [Dictyostelium firmibasis]|uniref:SHSP domain-containing protein n=1 Tax=Dictyostelium firmibasis TaxID=79012 RepID=A0AAN7YQ52_9MYCE
MEFDPRREMRKLQKKMNVFDHRLISSNGNYSSNHRINIWRPTVSIKDNKTHISIIFELAGISRDQIQIEVTKENTLVITGEKKSKGGLNSLSPSPQSNNPDSTLNNSGTPSTTAATLPNDSQLKNIITIGKFIRSYKLPPGTDSSKIIATMDDGLLEIIIPKDTPSEDRLKIPIQSKL